MHAVYKLLRVLKIWNCQKHAGGDQKQKNDLEWPYCVRSCAYNRLYRFRSKHLKFDWGHMYLLKTGLDHGILNHLEIMKSCVHAYKIVS